MSYTAREKIPVLRCAQWSNCPFVFSQNWRIYVEETQITGLQRKPFVCTWIPVSYCKHRYLVHTRWNRCRRGPSLRRAFWNFRWPMGANFHGNRQWHRQFVGRKEVKPFRSNSSCAGYKNGQRNRDDNNGCDEFFELLHNLMVWQ